MTLTEAAKARQKRYAQSEKGRAAHARACAKYSETDGGKIMNARADAKHRLTEKRKVSNARSDAKRAGTEKRKLSRNRGNNKYRQSEKGKSTLIEWNQSEAGKSANARHSAKRKRALGYRPINNHFEGSNGHHINSEDVIFIPKELHQSISHSQDDPESMKVINGAAFEWLCTQETL